ncbi:defensin-5-like [Orycteropus afer afer]|uniref:Defensin-5-like n=1 Tax=Orycteropus afer afer TaxID=1230840 RepID=A0A8B7B7Y3_ORYAF|nr:defensin-5-like [Orycteropus afer afer]
MRTLTLLAAILLLVLQAQAEPVRQTDDDIPAQDEAETGDQYVAISFAGDKRSAQGASGLLKRNVCYCRRGCCHLRERNSGTCTIKGSRHTVCCL